MKLVDAIGNLRVVSVELDPPAPQLDRAFYLHALDGDAQRIADHGHHIGVEMLEEIRHAIKSAYAAGCCSADKEEAA